MKKSELCPSCADLNHLVYLPAGDAILTRRETEYSHLHAKVLQLSRTGKHYELQGLLVETKALDKAEEECIADAKLKQRRRQRETEKRALLDQQYIEQFAERILKAFPYLPVETTDKIAQQACLKYSDRVGLSAAAKSFDPEAIILTVRAHVRHNHKYYDELLLKDYNRREARLMVSAEA